MPWAEQAIFTSTRGTRLDGYQLAAASPGITAELAKELTRWGPAHDSLYEPLLASPSVAWFPLSGERHCLAVTQPTDGEYSGRHGPRIYTHLIVLLDAVLERLANPAWQLFRALHIAGRFLVRDPLPERLERCPIHILSPSASRGSSAEHRELAELLREQLKGEPADRTLALPCDGDANARFEALWWALPASLRSATSFCTGLRYTLRRPFRVQAVPNDCALLRQLEREREVSVLAGSCASIGV
jgi:hypothetical protein